MSEMSRRRSKGRRMGRGNAPSRGHEAAARRDVFQPLVFSGRECVCKGCARDMQGACKEQQNVAIASKLPPPTPHADVAAGVGGEGELPIDLDFF